VLTGAAGERRLLRWQTAYLRDADGRRTGALKSGNDITEHRILQDQANRRARLEAIGTLAGGIAHDLNNALTPITMGLESIAAAAPDLAHLVGMLDTSTRRASALVRQLLNFAKGAAGEQRPFSPGPIVHEVGSLVERTFPKAIVFTRHVAPGLPTVRGDPSQLHQVLLNLCVNARDAMPDGGALGLTATTVEWRADATSSGFVIGTRQPGRYLVLSVTDTGSGIARETLDRIFEPFFTTKGPERGTGLGLSNVLGIVRGTGGSVQVETAPGRGSTFTVWLPAVAAAAVDETPGDDAPFSGQGRRVLYVDDEPAIRVLAANGCSVGPARCPTRW
jgi:signal transduction histidine kinase